jgi:hypothetical protein
MPALAFAPNIIRAIKSSRMNGTCSTHGEDKIYVSESILAQQCLYQHLQTHVYSSYIFITLILYYITLYLNRLLHDLLFKLKLCHHDFTKY